MTENVAEPFAQAVCGVGWAEIAVNALTVNVALPDVAGSEHGPVTTTLNAAPLSPLTVAGVVYEDDVAPEMFVPFLRHW